MTVRIYTDRTNQTSFLNDYQYHITLLPYLEINVCKEIQPPYSVLTLLGTCQEGHPIKAIRGDKFIFSVHRQISCQYTGDKALHTKGCCGRDDRMGVWGVIPQFFLEN